MAAPASVATVASSSPASRRLRRLSSGSLRARPGGSDALPCGSPRRGTRRTYCLAPGPRGRRCPGGWRSSGTSRSGEANSTWEGLLSRATSAGASPAAGRAPVPPAVATATRCWTGASTRPSCSGPAPTRSPSCSPSTRTTGMGGRSLRSYAICRSTTGPHTRRPSKLIIDYVKVKHPKATHNCWAYEIFWRHKIGNWWAGEIASEYLKDALTSLVKPKEIDN